MIDWSMVPPLCIGKFIEDPSCGCWDWVGALQNGYGYVFVNRVQVYAHRYAFAWWNGYYPISGMYVRHLCNNPRCCNPAHLAEGTPRENWLDSEEVHRKVHSDIAYGWNVAGIMYPTVRAASAATGVHQGTLIKYTDENRVFDVQAYREGCRKCRRNPPRL